MKNLHDVERQFTDDDEAAAGWGAIALAILAIGASGLLMGCTHQDSGPADPVLSDDDDFHPPTHELVGVVVDGVRTYPVYRRRLLGGAR